MSISFSQYSYGYRIVSIALDESTKNDLLSDNLDFLYIDDKMRLFPDNIVLCNDSKQLREKCHFSNFDVFEIFSNGNAKKVFDINSIDNYFFVSGKCNSNCIMCPSPEYSRKFGNNSSAESLIEIAKHIPITANHLTITGGEPFIIGESIFDFFDFLKNKFIYTDFLILTNGRIFSVKKYADLLAKTIPCRCTVAIPLHGSVAKIHDFITQTKNSFVQTMYGIRNLLERKIRVEIRIVISKLNIDDFENIAKLIVNELNSVAYISIIAPEMTGNAYVNRNNVWISYKTAFEKIADSVMFLIKSGIDVKLYNFPFCTVKNEFWTLCEKSISQNKVRFADTCNNCRMKNACSGVFAGTIGLLKDELEAL